MMWVWASNSHPHLQDRATSTKSARDQVKGFASMRWLWFVLAAGLVVGFVLLAPSSMGGAATWVSTSGISMEPDIQAGDLVIARPAPSYDAGDVVAYPSETLDGTVVLHRIVAEKPGGFVTKGDNNDWLDPDRPQTSEFLGELWLHIPGGGRVLTVFANPFVIVALIVALLTVGGLFTVRRTRGRGSRRASTATIRRTPLPMTAFRAREWAAAAALAAIALSVFAFGRPTTSTVDEQIDAQSSGKLSYSASVDIAGVYSDERIRTGDPVFLSVASAVDTHLNYLLGFDPEDVTGTISSTARLSASNGWSREIPLGAETRIDGNRVERSLPLDFASLLKMVHTAERRAATVFGSYTIEVIHHIDARGTVAGRQVTTTSSPKLTFALSDQQAVLQGGPQVVGKPVTVTEASSVAVPGTAPATVTVLRWDLPVSVLRVLAIALGLAALILAWRAVSTRGAAQQPRAIFGSRLVRAENVDFGDRSLVDVADSVALAKLATTYDAVVLHVVRTEDQLFLVIADQTVYRCTETVSIPEGSRRDTMQSVS